MNQKNENHLKQSIIPAEIYTKNFANKAANETFVKGKASKGENDYIKKAEELLAPYYDEFHFANYE